LTADHIEREVKLGADPAFVVPPIDGLVPLADEVLDATYYDSADLRLARDGATLRYRNGTWTAKLPNQATVAAAADGHMARVEVEVAGRPEAPPAELVALVRSRLRSADLTPVARLVSRRRRSAIVDHSGDRVAEIDDDAVEVWDGERMAMTFREVEVELTGGADESVLDAVVGRLRAAGAGAPDPTSKLARALGERALAPPDVAPVKLDDADRLTAADVVRAAIASSVRRLIDHDPVVRLGTDPEGVHQARVATRRLRSDLRTFRRIVDDEWAKGLRDELGWLADHLGAVRDQDVLLARLRDLAKELPDADARAASLVLDRLAAERDDTRRPLLEVLDSQRYLRLLDALVDAARAPRVGAEAAGRAADVVAPLVRKPWRRLRREVRALDDEPSDDALHQVRIRAKRARYAADVAVPVVGKPARALSKALANLQDVLGDQHDAVVAEAWLRSALSDGTSVGTDTALAVGELIGAERAAAARLRDEWRNAWGAADDKRLRRWLQ
jgi:CHAD domain-containing protein